MVSAMSLGALVAASLLSVVAAQSTSGSILLIPTPTTTVPLKEMTTVGCYATGIPLEGHGPHGFQTDGNCQGICVGLSKGVMGLVNGTDCWCGDKLPPKDTEVDMTECDTKCPGFPQKKCGGPDRFLIINSGFNPNRLVHFDLSSSSSQTSSTPATSAEPVSTVVVSTTPSEPPKKSEGPNKAGIAAGVVVGVLALAGIIGGVYFFLRQRRRRQVEEEYRRQAAVNSFVSGSKLHTSNSSMTDSRLDPEFMMRRQSNGSIADNEDYSRRILKVTNPDGN